MASDWTWYEYLERDYLTECGTWEDTEDEEDEEDENGEG